MDKNDKTMEELLKEDFRIPEVGKVVKGKIVQINEDEVVVNIGYKSDGIIPKDEVTYKPDINLKKIFNVGDEVEVLVLKEDDGEGNVLLSKKRVDVKKDWEKLEKAARNGDKIEVVSKEIVKGGLIAYFNEIRGFIPASQVNKNYVKDLAEDLNKKLKVKVIEIDRKNNKVVFSHKEVLEQEAEELKKRLWENIEKDTVVKGIVKRITDFGVFVDIGGMDGLIHISELSWHKVKHPSEILKEGDEVEVYILDFDRDKERISLSLRKTIESPWEKIGEKYKIGDIVEGDVVKITDFGAFIEIEPGIQGLVHLSQLSHERVTKPESILKVGDRVSVKIIDINQREKRMSLSLKEAIEAKNIEDYKDRIHEKDRVSIKDIIESKMEN